MNNKWMLIGACVLVTICGYGCGGGSSSSDDNVVSSNNLATDTNNNVAVTSAEEQSLGNTLEINALNDLGIDDGSSICFAIKAYTNISKSDLSDSVCAIVNSSEPLLLTWSNYSADIIGYEIYYGSSANTIDNYYHNYMIL